MKTVSIFLALINSLFTCLLIAVDLSYYGFMQGIWWWSLLKLSAGCLVILVGISVWLGEMGVLPPGPVLLGGVFLIALGPATLVWTAHVALVTGGIEYDIVVYSMSLLVQGLASLLGAAGGVRSTAAS